LGGWGRDALAEKGKSRLPDKGKKFLKRAPKGRKNWREGHREIKLYALFKKGSLERLSMLTRISKGDWGWGKRFL